MRSRPLKLVIAFVSCSIAVFAQDNGASCPMELDFLKPPFVVAGIGTSSGHTKTGGKLSFRYKNLSGRDIQAITLRVSGRIPVPGPTGPSFLHTSHRVVVNRPMLANTSKKISVRVSNTNTNWVGLHAELEQVRFADGQLWSNDGNLDCVLMSQTSNRHQTDVEKMGD